MKNNFNIKVRIYYEDTDSGGVVYHANYLKFLERARTEWFRKAGITQSVLRKAQNIVFVVSSLKIQYHKPASLDDELIVDFRVVKLRNCSILCKQEIQKEQERLVSSEILIACIDLKNHLPQKIPQKILQAFGMFENI